MRRCDVRTRQPKMRSRLRSASWVMVAPLLVSCGGPSADERAAADEARADRLAAEERQERDERREERAAARRAEQQETYDTCVEIVMPLSDALSEVDSRLAVGLSYDEYTNYLGDVQVAYDAVLDRLDEVSGSDDCLGVAIKLESALNAYARVSNVWSDCNADLYCDFSEADPNTKAQRGWAQATRLLEQSDSRLDELAPPVGDGS